MTTLLVVFVVSVLMINVCSICNGLLTGTRINRMSGTSNYITKEPLWFNQTLDHFSPYDHRKFGQRYYEYLDHFRIPDGPIFLVICGESTCGGISNDYITVLAKKFGAAMVTLEHRYYGKSSPFDSLTTENLKFLSSKQALYDLATFRQFYQKKLIMKVYRTSDAFICNGLLTSTRINRMSGTSSNYITKEPLWFNQTLDHFSPYDHRKFGQRYYEYLDHFRIPDGPIFLVICGESTCGGISNDYITVLAKKFGAAMVTLEHRYYGKSSPFDSLTTENLKFLSSKQALYDLATFRQFYQDHAIFIYPAEQSVIKHTLIHTTLAHSKYIVSTIYQSMIEDFASEYYDDRSRSMQLIIRNKEPTGDVQESLNLKLNRENVENPWFVFGISYAGALSAWFRLKFPHLTCGSVASSGVVHAILNFEQYDQQIGESVGPECKAILQEVTQLVEKQLDSDGESIKTKFGASELEVDGDFMYMLADGAAEAVRLLLVILIQYGNPDKLCIPMIEAKKAGEDIVDAYAKYVASLGFDIKSYTEEYLKNTSAPARLWWFQVCTEVAFFQVAPANDSIRSSKIDLRHVHTTYNHSKFGIIWIYAKMSLEKAFIHLLIPQIYTMGAQILLSLYIFGTIEPLTDGYLTSSKIVFTNGSQDPWRHASKQVSSPDMPAYIVTCHNCGHGTDLRGCPQSPLVPEGNSKNCSDPDAVNKSIYDDRSRSMQLIIRNKEPTGDVQESLNLKLNRENVENPWFVFGISYAGALSAWFRLKFPHLTCGSVASSGVVHAILNFEQYDQQIGESVGPECKAILQEVTQLVEKQLDSDGESIKTKFGASELKVDGDFMYMLADGAAEARISSNLTLIISLQIQYGNPDKLCIPMIEAKKAGEDIVDAYAKYVASLGFDIKSYTEEYLKNTSAPARLWWFQVCAEVAFFQVAPANDSIRSSKIDLRHVHTTYNHSKFGIIWIYAKMSLEKAFIHLLIPQIYTMGAQILLSLYIFGTIEPLTDGYLTMPQYIVTCHNVGMELILEMPSSPLVFLKVSFGLHSNIGLIVSKKNVCSLYHIVLIAGNSKIAVNPDAVNKGSIGRGTFSISDTYTQCYIVTPVFISSPACIFPMILRDILVGTTNINNLVIFVKFQSRKQFGPYFLKGSIGRGTFSISDTYTQCYIVTPVFISSPACIFPMILRDM
ncbi:peptidase S28, Alpha/Beta hydrolase fold protein [Artemisia annua]|uniref:Peptidase S28, Alpha/Beta hydrolase fold protein n=1 Tax=Artemisia annua TaxID=35608 RepID=A0A2U1MGK7_ARTAN|nr:peptidase S28, Alpha/Beta hydrolase fold protein [Artemisia annua]